MTPTNNGNFDSFEFNPGDDPYIRDHPKPNGGTASSAPLPYLGRDMPLRDREWLMPSGCRCATSRCSPATAASAKPCCSYSSAATVLGKDWLGMRPAVGPVLYLGAEDDADECAGGSRASPNTTARRGRFI